VTSSRTGAPSCGAVRRVDLVGARVSAFVAETLAPDRLATIIGAAPRVIRTEPQGTRVRLSEVPTRDGSIERPHSSHHLEGSPPLNIVTLCTGNVARSVMLGYMLTSLVENIGKEWTIRSAGTHVAEGSAMSGRTRDALLKIQALGEHRYGSHRSHQLNITDTEWAHVILAVETDNVNFVRANFALAGDKTVQLAQFVRFAPAVGSFDEKLRAVVAHEPTKDFDIDDPAGGDQATYDRCARQLWELAQSFAQLVEGESVD